MGASSPSRSSGALRVLIAGGGVAALEAALALRELAGDRVAVELLAPEPHFWYRPLAVVEPFGGGQVHGIELPELAHAGGVGFSLGALASVDPDLHVVRTTSGAEFEYDALLIACGARPSEAVEGALTFRGPADSDRFRDLLTECRAGGISKLVFAVPSGVSWPLPLYELALMTRAFLVRHGSNEVELALVTPEDAPLELFGGAASAAVAQLFEERSIAVLAGRHAIAFDGGTLTTVPGGDVQADRVVALPRLRGTPIEGVPRDANDFIPTDPSGRVRGVDDVFAAGDVTTFPVKQGGLAAQQACAAAEAIAATAGAEVDPKPFTPVLRGLVLTGDRAAFLRADLGGGAGETSTAQSEPLWWPPAKIVGRHFAPFLARWAGVVLTPPAKGDALPVEVDLSPAVERGNER